MIIKTRKKNNYKNSKCGKGSKDTNNKGRKITKIIKKKHPRKNHNYKKNRKQGRTYKIHKQRGMNKDIHNSEKLAKETGNNHTHNEEHEKASAGKINE
ncbi:hypothetical protein [Salegentibacter holothuriorum]|uniref:hypothetical protein n=1 Tax=Salegentibacter holothuriorum TaxID=241145 RepID=UPI0009A674FA|nr:hypothetical protein [Salegentibacter holothuriorum]